MSPHLLSLADLPRASIEALLDSARALRGRWTDDLAGRSVVLLFLSPSLRTRVSMELAAKQLGAAVVNLQAGNGLWGFEHRPGAVMDGAAAEHLKEAAGVLSRYGDLLAVRAFPARRSWEEDRADPILSGFAAWSRSPVLNLESARYHPCQALADLLTLSELDPERRGPIVLRWTDHPKALPVAVPSSFALAATRLGWSLSIARPEGYALPPDVNERCRAFAAAAGSRFVESDDPEASMDGARVVYAKSWGRIDRYGQEERELAERSERGLARWRVTAEAMARTDEAAFLHCLPVRRGVVVDDAVIDGPRSRVLDQAENRLHAQKALLKAMLAPGGLL